MGRIFVTGDVHGDIDIKKLNTSNFPIQRDLTKDDYVIIAGDFGGVWYGSSDLASSNPDYILPPQHKAYVGKDDYWLKWLENKPFTTLFVDGNHENHALLDTYAVEEWKGGKIHRIRPSVIHLMRGQVYEIAGETWFTMGGATSRDQAYRKENLSWWARELPDETEYEEANRNLSRYQYQVDYVITHCIGNRIAGKISQLTENDTYPQDSLTDYLDGLEDILRYKCWFFGHYHQDMKIDEQHRLLYQDIIEI